MSLLGATCYRWGPDVEAKVRLLQPHFVVVGNGVWNDLPAIIAACPPDVTIILRNMADNLIDWNVVDVLNGMLEVVERFPKTKFVGHALNESYSNVPKAVQWEWDFIERCHDNGMKTVALNLAYGNDPDPRYKGVADATDYIGQHLYDGYIESEQRFVDRIHTSRRYASNWLNDYRHKIISTEVGIESFPGTGQRRGWHDMGLSETMVRDRLLANAMEWYADGLLGACWFTAGHTEQSWDVGYGMTELMARSWAKLPAPNNSNGGNGMPQYGGGFADLATKLGADVVGTPLTDEYQETEGGKQFTYQQTSNGKMVYADGIQPYFLAGLREVNLVRIIEGSASTSPTTQGV